MSFSIFLQCFRDREPATFERAVFEEIFGRDAVNAKYPLTDVTYLDKSGGEIHGGEDDHIQHMMFSHCGGDRFFDALQELAARTMSVLFWPATGRQIAVSDSAVIAHLPSGFDDMGPAFIVSSGRELQTAIAESD
jgi:hypothetical protein